MRKYVAEFVGTLILTLFGCGSAAIAGGTLGTLGIALAFGLSIVALAYAIGDVSGCHINPAVSLAMYICKKLDLRDFICYVASQILGAIAGAGILALIVNNAALGGIAVTGLGANGFGTESAVGLNMVGAIIVEAILTFVFVLTILGVTSSPRTSNIAGIVIGLTFALVHIIGIPLTGASVNPARSIGPALFIGGTALAQVWVFVLAPLAGAAIAALFWIFICKPYARHTPAHPPQQRPPQRPPQQQRNQDQQTQQRGVPQQRPRQPVQR